MVVRVINLNVKRQMIYLANDTTQIVNNTRHYLKCCFAFDSEWDGILYKTAVFQASYGKGLKVILDDTNCCYVPFEILRYTSFKVSVFGDDLLTTHPISVKMLTSGPVDGEEPSEDEVLWYNQILDRLDRLTPQDIIDENGQPLPRRSNIEYRNLRVEDDPDHNKTVIESEFLTNEEIDEILK